MGPALLARGREAPMKLLRSERCASPASPLLASHHRAALVPQRVEAARLVAHKPGRCRRLADPAFLR